MRPVIFLYVSISGNPLKDTLLHFDPVNDWFVSWGEYLTWRQFGTQRIPFSAYPVAVADQNGRFLVKESAWEPKFDWMRYVASNRAQKSLPEEWEPSNYQGLFGLPKDLDDLHKKLELINVFNSPIAEPPPSDWRVEMPLDSYLYEPIKLVISGGRIQELQGVRSNFDSKQLWLDIRNDLISHQKRMQSEKLLA